MNKILFVGSNPPPLRRPLGPDGMTATTRRLNHWMESAGITAPGDDLFLFTSAVLLVL